MTEKRAKELADIEPPRSVVRLSGFLRDLTASGMPRLEPLALGGGPLMGLAARPPFLPGGGFIAAFARLTAHYAVQADDLEAFARWLILWTSKYTEMEVIEDPKVYDAPAFAPPSRSLANFAAAAPPLPKMVSTPTEPTGIRASEAGATERRTRRRGDPAGAATERPAPRPEEPPEALETAREEGLADRRALHRPVRRPVATTVEETPPRRINLAALFGRAQAVTFGAGAMATGMAIAAPRGLVDLPLLSHAVPEAGAGASAPLFPATAAVPMAHASSLPPFDSAKPLASFPQPALPASPSPTFASIPERASDRIPGVRPQPSAALPHPPRPRLTTRLWEARPPPSDRHPPTLLSGPSALPARPPHGFCGIVLRVSREARFSGRRPSARGRSCLPGACSRVAATGDRPPTATPCERRIRRPPDSRKKGSRPVA